MDTFETQPTPQTAPAPRPKSTAPAIIAAIVISALITGGGVYAYQKQQGDATQKDLQAQIDTLTAQVNSPKKVAATATPTPTPTPSPTASTSPKAVAPITVAAAYAACQKETAITTLKDSTGAYFTLCSEKLAVLGDVDGDGAADVVIPVTSDVAKSSGETRLAVYLNSSGAPKYAGISSIFQAEETLQSLAISDTKVKATLATTRAEFPTLTRTYALENGTLVDKTTM